MNDHRAIVWGVVAVLLAVLAILTLDREAATGAPTSSRILVVTTQNVRHTLGPVRAGHDLRQAQRGSDVTIAQEMGSRRAARFRLAGYGVVQPGDRIARELAVYYRRARLQLVAAVPFLLHRSTLFGSATRNGLAVMFRYTARPGCLLVLNVHLIPHIEVGGRPRDLPRLQLVDLALDRIVALARMLRRGCALVVGGDWNVDGYADRRIRAPVFPAARFAALGYGSDWRFRVRPTLGRRNVDGFFYRNAHPIARRILAGTFSDHNGSRTRVVVP